MMIKQFSTNVQLLCQQLDSRFAKAVRVEPIHAEYAFFDQIGPDIAGGYDHETRAYAYHGRAAPEAQGTRNTQPYRASHRCL